MDWFALLYADPEVNPFLRAGRTAGPEEARRTTGAVVSDAMRRGFGCWAIADKDTGTHGSSQLDGPWVGRSDEIAFLLLALSAIAGSGIATEAASALVRLAFEEACAVKDGMGSIENPDSFKRQP